MLRVTTHRDDRMITLQLEGRLAGPAVIEAERCWQVVWVENPGQPLQIDLRAVTFIDHEGIALLKQAYREGADFLTSGCLTRAYVEQVTCSGRSRIE